MFILAFVVLQVYLADGFHQLPPKVHVMPSEKNLSFGSQNESFWRVVGGRDAPEGAFPHMASLRISGSHLCGGSVMNNRWVLTAAHCINNPSGRLSIVVGSNSLSRGGDTYPVDKVIYHEGYDADKIIHDVGVVRTATEIRFSQRVKPIRLPERNTGGNARVVLSGWGMTYDNSATPDRLQMIELNTLTVEKCQQALAPTNMPITEAQICTFTRTGEGICRGDSGSGLVEGNNVVGIASWVIPCAEGYPDVYARVYHYKNWILQHIGHQ